MTRKDIEDRVKLEWVIDKMYGESYPISRAYFGESLYFYVTNCSCRLIDKYNKANGNFEIDDDNELGIDENKEIARKWAIDFVCDVLGIEE